MMVDEAVYVDQDRMFYTWRSYQVDSTRTAIVTARIGWDNLLKLKCS